MNALCLASVSSSVHMGRGSCARDDGLGQYGVLLVQWGKDAIKLQADKRNRVRHGDRWPVWRERSPAKETFPVREVEILHC